MHNVIFFSVLQELKNEEKLEDLRSKITTLNCTTPSLERGGFIITPVVDVQSDEDNERVLTLESGVTGRVHSIEGQIQRLNSKLDSRLNSQSEFEPSLMSIRTD